MEIQNFIETKQMSNVPKWEIIVFAEKLFVL